MFGFDKTPEITSGAQRAAILMAHKINWQGEFYRNLPDARDFAADNPSRQVLRHERRREKKRSDAGHPRMKFVGLRARPRKLQLA